jgi:hypothetical protein
MHTVVLSLRNRFALYRHCIRVAFGLTLLSCDLAQPGASVDYYQGVVLDYLRNDRAIFVNPECCIQLKDGKSPSRGEHWFCDAVAIDLNGPTVFLCETSYAAGLGKLINRLTAWSQHWAGVEEALHRDCKVPVCWPVRPWLFIPQEAVQKLVARVNLMAGADGKRVFRPRITTLESVQPWQRTSWLHRDCDTDKSKSGIPEEMWA